MRSTSSFGRLAIRKALGKGLEGLALGGRAVLPNAKPSAYGVELIRDLSYGVHPIAHRLDVYRKKGAKGAPVVLYIHGGGFRILSKDTHWSLALPFAERGFVVFVINYRLAPRDPFPAAVEDVFDAYRWVLDHAEDYGGDPSRLVVAGESAGANLSTALTLACCTPFEAPFARRVFALEKVPDVIVPLCGILQVSDTARFRRRKKLAPWLDEMIVGVERDYLREGLRGVDAALADPLVWLESDATPERALPPIFTSVGTKDPLLDDHRRFVAALERRGVPHEAPIYPGMIHAFQAAPMLAASRDSWRRAFDFVDARLR